MIFAALVPMPETAVDENDRSVFSQNQIGVPGEPRMIQPVAEATAEQELPHKQFRLRVLALYRRHATMALLLGQFVHL